MALSTLAVLSLMAVATVWLLVHTRVWLPRQLQGRILDSAKAFGTAVELRFPSHQGLMKRVIALSDAVAKELGLSARQRRELELAGRLRDVGLCAIPYRLVNGLPFPEWNVAEKATYFRHAEVGAAMLELLPELARLAPVVRLHHARYDGGDDPTAPCGLSIPVEARILRVVADYVWHERLRGGLIAREMLRDARGTSYCPEAVDSLLSVLSCARVEQRESSFVLS